MMEVHEKNPLSAIAATGAPVDCIMELNATYAVLSSCASFFLPSIFMVGLYVRLYIYARRHVNSMKVRQLAV